MRMGGRIHNKLVKALEKPRGSKLIREEWLYHIGK
jgi:hypothetical protein